ncbi:MAG: hypothetical protein ACQERN_02935 [Thermodesulfobacteriota bacterium]
MPENMECSLSSKFGYGKIIAGAGGAEATEAFAAARAPAAVRSHPYMFSIALISVHVNLVSLSGDWGNHWFLYTKHYFDESPYYIIGL